MVFSVPAMVIVMTPPKLQLHVLVLFRAGIPPISTVGDPGFQGVVTGTHGAPSNAAHAPNVGMFTVGLKSMMFAAGVFSATVRLTGNTIRLAGDAPCVHFITAPIFTCCAMALSPVSLRPRQLTHWVQTSPHVSPATRSAIRDHGMYATSSGEDRRREIARRRNGPLLASTRCVRRGFLLGEGPNDGTV